MILFWFCAVAVQPIALYELGAHAARGTRLAVGAHPDYPRRNTGVRRTSRSEGHPMRREWRLGTDAVRLAGGWLSKGSSDVRQADPGRGGVGLRCAG
ncbi:hypothetical protein [Streptomyces sp. NPDC002845]